MIGLDHYNRSMMLWLLGKFRETEQKKWCPTHGIHYKVTPHQPRLKKLCDLLLFLSVGSQDVLSPFLLVSSLICNTFQGLCPDKGLLLPLIPEQDSSINFPNTTTISLVNICHCHTLYPHNICFITKSLYLYLFCSSYYPQTLVTTTLFSLYMS